MIHGIGTDIVSIPRVAAILARFGERFVNRILTERERAELDAAAEPAAFLARRFAAKEAAAKALGTGIRGPFAFNAIEVRREAGCRPQLYFLAAAAEAAGREGVGQAHLSLSDERDFAVAFVILLRR